jgi:hypothetical protein
LVLQACRDLTVDFVLFLANSFSSACADGKSAEVIMNAKRIHGGWAATLATVGALWAAASMAADQPRDFRELAAAGRATLAQQAAARQSIVKSLGFKDGEACYAPPPITAANIDVHRSLLVHDAATLNAGNFTLRRTLQKLADDVAATAPGVTAETIFQQLWDTQNDAAKAQLPANTHCSDNDGKLNGFPWGRCARPEGEEAIAPVAPRLDNQYKPIAIVNRLDLAGANWRNCGEHRIAYAKNEPRSSVLGSAFNYLIFEAVLPNPQPGCRSGCREVIEFWQDLSTDSNPRSRAAKLENFLYTGLPGFRPVVHTSHYSSGVAARYGNSGSGQIRTNQFLFGINSGPAPWTLKEFKTLLTCSGGACDYDVMPIPVKSNPYAPLWNADVAAGAAPPPPSLNPYATPVAGLAGLSLQFQSELLAQVTADKLAATDINKINFSVSPNLNAASGQVDQGTDGYRNQLNVASDASLRDALTAALASFPGLTPKHVANRALGLSCAGCHMPDDMMSASVDPSTIGPSLQWPRAGNFAHVQGRSSADLNTQAGFDPIHFDMNTNGFRLSPALIDTFLPFRRAEFVDRANDKLCDCVPVRGNEVSIPLTSQQADIVNFFSKNTRSVLQGFPFNGDAWSRLFFNQKQLFSMAKSVIRESEQARDALLEKTGLRFDLPSLQPRPAQLSPVALQAAERNKLKQSLALEIANGEPPRETVTGSFRVH